MAKRKSKKKAKGYLLPKYQTEGRIKTYKDPSEFIKASKAFEDSAFAALKQQNIFEDKVQSGDYDVYPPAKRSVADPAPIVDYDEAYNKALSKDEAEIAYGNITSGNTLGYSNYRGINPVGYLQAINSSNTGPFARIYPMYKPPVVTPVLTESIESVPVKSSTQLQTRPLQEDRLTTTAIEPSIKPSIEFLEKTEYTAADYPMIDTKARREGRVGNTVVPRGDFNKGNNKGRVEINQNGGSINKYQNDGRVQGNVNDWLINTQELQDYRQEYNRMSSKCRSGKCLERAAMYYDQNVAGLLGTSRYNTIKDNAGISSSDPEAENYAGPHARYEEYGDSPDSWDIHGLLQEKGAKQIYAYPLYNKNGSQLSTLEYTKAYNDFKKKPLEEREQFFKDMKMPIGSIIGMGTRGGSGSKYGTTSYNIEQGLIPSNHSAVVVGYDETGLPYVYDYTGVMPITEKKYDFMITNITAPKEVEKFTYDYLKNTGELADTYRPLKLNVSDKETNSEYDVDEFDPFIKALEDNKLEISNSLGIDFNMYDELAKRAVATAISETKGGDDTVWRPAEQLGGMYVPSYIADKLGFGKTTGITQINEDLIWGRVGTEEQRKGNRMPAKLNALGIKEKDYDPWDPEQQAKATIAFLYDNLEVGRKNLKSGVNEETGTKNKLDLPDEQVGYYQWFQPNLMADGVAWGESEKVKNFAKAYAKVSLGYSDQSTEETPTVLSPPASDSRQYGGNVEQDPLYTSLLNTFQNGGEIKEDYNIKRAEELGYTRDETGHMPSVDHETGMWLKSKEHPTAHKEYISMMLNPDIKAVVNPEGYFEENQLQYIPRKENGGEVLPEELPHQEIVSFPTEREPAGDPRVPKFASAQDYYTNLENTPVPKTISKKYKIWEDTYKSPMGLPIKSYKNIYDIQAFFNSGNWKEDFKNIENYRKSSHPMLGSVDPKTNTFIPSEENLNTNEEIASHIDINAIPVNFKKVERIPINPDGFAPGSATEFADKVVIPSGNITMKDMQEPILANGEMLMPGDEAQFDTDYVVEEKLPKAQDGLKVEGKNLSKKEVDDIKNFVEDDTNFVQEYPYLLPEVVIEDKLDRTNPTAVRNWSKDHDPIAYAAREATDEAAPYVATGLGAAFAPAGASLLGAGARGLAAAGEATYGSLSPYASAAWNASIPGMSSVPGATVGNLINAGFGTHGATNIAPDALELLTNPLSLENLGNVGIDALEMAPMYGPTSKMLGELGTTGRVGKSKTIPLTHSKKGGFKGDFLKDKTLIGEGSEFTVYKDTKGNVFKIGEAYNSPETFNPRIEQALKLNEIGGVPTELVGHWKSPNGIMNPIFKQPFIKGKKATQKEIDTYFKNKGFNKIKDGTYSNSKSTISDIDPDNVIIDSNNKVNIIDAFIEPTSAAEAALLKEYLPTGMGIKGHKPGDALLGNYTNVLNKGYDIHDVRLKYHNNMFVDFDEMAMLQKFGKGNKKNYERANTEDILGSVKLEDKVSKTAAFNPRTAKDELFGVEQPKVEVPIKAEPTIKSSDAAPTGTNLSKGEQNIIPLKKLEIPNFFSKPFKRTAKSRASDKWMEDWFYHPETKKRFINYGGTEKEWEAVLNTLENPLRSNYTWGKGQPGGSYSPIINQASVPLDATVGVGVHENAHKTGILLKESNPILHRLWNDFTEAVRLVPSEAYPEIMRFRQMLGIKPGQKLGLETMKKNLHLLSDGYMMNFKIKDHKKLLDIINKAPALLPPAAIIGAESAKSKD